MNISFPKRHLSGEYLKIILSISSLMLYSICFLLLFPVTGSVAGAMVILPVGIIAYIYGPRTGLMIGVLSFFLNGLLFAVFGFNSPEFMLKSVPSLIVTITIGGFTGYISELREKLNGKTHQLLQEKETLRQEVAKRETAEAELLNIQSGLQSAVEKRTAELADSGNYLMNLLNSIPTGVMVIDAATHCITDINATALQLFKAERKEAIGHICHQFVCSTEAGQCPITDFHQTMDSTERVIYALDGTKIPILKSVVPIYNNSKQLLVESLVDISKLKEAEAALRLNEEQLKLIFQNLIDVAFALDENFFVVNVSPSIEKLLGYKPVDVIGRRINELNLLTQDSLRKATLQAAVKFQNGPTENNIYDFICGDGTIKKLEVHSSLAVTDTDKKLVCVARDVSGRIRIEEELKEYNSALLELNKKLNESETRLKELNSNKDKFFSIIAHDLKSPFNSLLGFSDFMLSDYETLSDEEIKSFTQNINSSAKHLFKLLENLLQWSMIQTGKMEYLPSNLDIQDLAEDIRIMLNGNAVKKNIQVKNLITPETFVFADKGQITSVLQNLISNALKFTPAGGNIRISAAIMDDLTEISVEDTGLGMEESDLKKLFRIDVHHSTTGTNQERGTGLGLILCREMVERNGGNIGVESIRGKGSRFFFTLPRALEDVVNRN